EAAEVLDARGLHVLPGVIDPQVHFREPGLTHKEDLESGTRAALLGGVTSVLEMPNTLPPTASLAALADKRARAAGRVWCDIGFFGGATTENAEDLAALEAAPGCAGIKIFMGSSTGSLLVPDDASLLRVLRAGRRRVAVHAEDEDRLRERRPLALTGHPETHPVWRDEETAVRATRRLLTAAREAGRPVHVLHVTTAGELPLLAAARDLATFETLPQHLTFEAPGIYERLGTLAQMNPPIREARHRDALWEAVRSGLVDCLATDHAPHTLEEKARPYPESPSGMPGVQTLLPVLLDHVARGRLSLERLVALTSAGPARVWEIPGKGRLEPGFDADLVLVDLERRHTLTAGEMATRCGWTPFEGLEVTGWPVATILRGHVAMRDGEALGSPSGRVLYSSPTSS
ncbi:MAG: dihydroorotase, partial [Acidobacteria bacterium]|nr:dihydroorotase [Acidobacteriota bacterium]